MSTQEKLDQALFIACAGASPRDTFASYDLDYEEVVEWSVTHSHAVLEKVEDAVGGGIAEEDTWVVLASTLAKGIGIELGRQQAREENSWRKTT